jgi:hypothetical protein
LISRFNPNAAGGGDSRLYVLGIVLLSVGFGAFLLPIYWQTDEDRQREKVDIHGANNVSQKPLDTSTFLYYDKYMANVLPIEKQVAIIGSLCEGSSIRSIERMTGVHRDTIMRLGVKVGQGCTALMDETIRNLSCDRLEMDEIWGFVGKKDRNVREGDDAHVAACGRSALSTPTQNLYRHSRSASAMRLPQTPSCRTWRTA